MVKKEEEEEEGDGGQEEEEVVEVQEEGEEELSSDLLTPSSTLRRSRRSSGSQFIPNSHIRCLVQVKISHAHRNLPVTAPVPTREAEGRTSDCLLVREHCEHPKRSSKSHLRGGSGGPGGGFHRSSTDVAGSTLPRRSGGFQASEGNVWNVQP